jgi:hypothetical protein
LRHGEQHREADGTAGFDQPRAERPWPPTGGPPKMARMTVEIAGRLGWKVIQWGGDLGLTATYHVTPASWRLGTRSTRGGDVFATEADALAAVAKRTADALGISVDELALHLARVCR